MKTYWSAFLLLSLLLLTACGQEQFGTPAQGEQSGVNALKSLQQNSCANLTLISPPVDILYVVDNSTSTESIRANIKAAIKSTIESVPAHFDYRIIGTPLLKTTDGDNHFQVLAKDPSSLPPALSSKKISSYNEFQFFNKAVEVSGPGEPGLARVRDFMHAHQNDGLFRQDGYVLVILVSNGRDTDIETSTSLSNGETNYREDVYDQRLQELVTIKSLYRQFRLFSVTASTQCSDMAFNSTRTYVRMSNDLYLSHMPKLDDQKDNPNPDHYNLCSQGFLNVFNAVNTSIKKVVLKHKYQYWPVTFNPTVGFDPSTIRVFKSPDSNKPYVELPKTAWQYKGNIGTVNTRIEPTPGESTSLPVVEFISGNEIITPECVTITSTTNVEYYKYFVLTKAPQTDTLVVKVNGQLVPSSAYTYKGLVQDTNIKVSYKGYSELPADKRSGYFIEITNPAYYYKSGDNVEVGFKPAPI